VGKEYHKLVRDRIPEIIRKSGNECEVVILSDAEYCQALRQKLMEEAGEAAEANGEDLVAELADLYEVIDALMRGGNFVRCRILSSFATEIDGRSWGSCGG